ncbi:DUF2631 domain-containing protein [Tsukamurella sp. 8F]|uniref:DUF2631 domain-containing protein n=1 Tax=unclassified Tsukamurella TaxID=2633480 RepID=UPI0023B97E59|nr:MULTISPECIES: DUF2631 domain-containing protein [unclassified Tsukamurella]MDF0531577.1 DUF2631 domain-containing protein [Tsukamurella sp. 8J]MDF0587576.1 DUF2631 domain-containing protein [Tsukamurella sp. 8F]
MATTDLERQSTSKVDLADAPSRDWGWHGTSRNGARIAGVVVAIFLVCMIHGNQIGHVEDVWLVGFALLLLFAVARDVVVHRGKWKSTPKHI